jgi:uncharacterized protein (TIGR01777 family)
MKILISGSSGQVGSALIPALARQRHEVWRLLRLKEKPALDPRVILWDPTLGALESQALEGFDAVVHLGGLNLASARWNEDFKKQAWDSRVESTRLLAQTLASLKQPPKVFLCASAVGIYGDRGLEELDEYSSLGSDFLAQLCKAWEEASQPAASKGIRVIHARFGMILSKNGGAIARMILPFKLGLGGRIGSGKQIISWIALPDLVAALLFLLEKEDIEGAYNLVTANPVSNYNFTRALGRAVARPTIFPMPAFAARLVLGEMADALLLASQKVIPKRLKEAGFKFKLPYIGEALGRVLE